MTDDDSVSVRQKNAQPSQIAKDTEPARGQTKTPASIARPRSNIRSAAVMTVIGMVAIPCHASLSTDPEDMVRAALPTAEGGTA